VREGTGERGEMGREVKGEGREEKEGKENPRPGLRK